MLVPKDGPSWTDSTLNACGTMVAVAMTKETQKRSWVPRLKISVWTVRGARSVGPWWMRHRPSHLLGEEGSSSPCGGFFSSFLHCIHPMLVSLRSALRPGRMWRGFCRFLSNGVSTPTPPICGYITAWGFLGSGRFTTPTCSGCSLLSSIQSPRHTFSPHEANAWSTPLVWNTQNRVRTHSKGCSLICCAPEPSLLSGLCPSGLWLKWTRRLCRHNWTDQSCLLLPLWRNTLLQSTAQRWPSDLLLLHTVCTRQTFKLIYLLKAVLFCSTRACQHSHSDLCVLAVKTVSWLPSAVCSVSLRPASPLDPTTADTFSN